MSLTPPDMKRCQCEELEGSFMTLGPRKRWRCEAVPTVVAKEKKPGPDGLIGSMSLCERHAVILKRKHPGMHEQVPILELRCSKHKARS